MGEKTPHEKKALSYEKDRRNTYGGNDKASRRLIPLQKASVSRNYRRKINQVLNKATGSKEPGYPETAEIATHDIRRKDWKKDSDEPLKESVERKLEYRESHAGHGKTALKNAREFVAGLEIETEQEADGRWIAEAVGMTGVLRYGDTRDSAIQECKSWARTVYLESIGAIEILSVYDSGISYESK